ncbi:MAG: manganese efflux pump MntP family protein [Lachnospiraceae bacterium]|nr:manganese efflux pump MntP family protein [Lachnospiraceae bacterium]
MSIPELFIIAIGLSMDAFAVSVCKGLSLKETSLKHNLIAGGYFGVFQALMPILGYLLGYKFQWLIVSVDHWVAFVLLVLIGIGMIKEAFGNVETLNDSFNFKTMFPLAIATSIDALAVGVTFAFLNVNIIYASIFIGITTFLFSAFGIKIGNVFGIKYKSGAEIFGGMILIAMGIKILIEHLGII